MRWTSALLLLIPVIGIVAWLTLGQRPPAPPAPLVAKGAAPAPKDVRARQRAYIRECATMIVDLEEQQPDMGKAHKERFQELLRTEAPLRLEYEAIKQERAAARAAR